jgi:hypothetical protein
MLTGEVFAGIGAVHRQVPFLHSRRRTGAYSVCARVIAC